MVRALNVSGGRFRHSIERMEPAYCLSSPGDTFRGRPVDEIARDPQRPYHESWAVALESMVIDRKLTTREVLDTGVPTERAPL